MTKIYIITDDLDEAVAGEMLGGYGRVIYRPCKTEQDIIEHCRDANILVSLYEPVTSAVIDALPGLRFIALASIGYNTVDVEHAAKKQIHVANNPHYCTEEVAEHTVAMILALNRRLPAYHRSVQQDRVWRYDAAGRDMHRMSTRTVGLVGFGTIARKVALRMQPFGCRIIAYDPYVEPEVGQKQGVEMVELDTLLREAHIISVHMPLTKQTANFFNRETFAQMARKPIFINCSRGGLVDEEALAEALDSGRVSAAGIDVLASETPDLENCRLMARPNVLLTPHAAFYSLEAMEEAQTLTLKYVQYFLQGELHKIPLVV